MSTLAALELRKHDLRVELVRTVKATNKVDVKAMKVWHKILEVQRAEAYLKREVTR